mgnify:CR=1 FL=1
MPAAGIGCEVAMSAKGASPMEKIESGAPATLTSSVYEQLRADLVSGHYKPGERLGADALRQRFEKVSFMVFR